MSTSILGKIIDENGKGVDSLTIEVLDVEGLHGDVRLGIGQTSTVGVFSFPITPLAPFSNFRVRIYDSVHRLLKEQDIQDNSSANIVVNFIVPSQLSQGLITTDENGHRLYFSSGNTIEFLIDNESAWSRITDAIHTASRTIHIQQFGFDISEYKNDVTKIEPTLITKFESVPQANVPVRKIQLESEMADASARNVQVSVVMHHSALWGRPPFVFSVKGFLNLFLDVGLALVLPDNAASVESYFSENAQGPPPRKPVRVRRFSLDRPTHAKLAIVDDQAFIIGSPFIQEYFDSTRFSPSGSALAPKPTHAIHELRRGKNGVAHKPIHDVSLSLSGPAVTDIDRSFLLHWNEARPDKSELGEAPAVVPPVANGVNVEVIRSLCKARFSDPNNIDTTNPTLILGEKRIHQAYLRAIKKAKEFIYIENQYFVEKEITLALIEQLKAEPNLKLILLLNNLADIPFYSTGLPIPILGLIIDFINEGRQQNRLEDLLEGLTAVNFDNRVGIYSLWTHENAPTANEKPRIINNYVHSKVAIIDDDWATVGSANLDVFSLSNDDNSEVNVQVFEDAKSQIKEFRGRLWGEHLGLDPTAVASNNDFLGIWKQRAKEKVNALKAPRPQLHEARILPFPPIEHTNTNIAFDIYKPGAYLSGLDIDIRNFTIVRAVPEFNFSDGKVTQPNV